MFHIHIDINTLLIQWNKKWLKLEKIEKLVMVSDDNN